ncbi:MAG TPA: alpha/beta hydrolase [Steroidobacteraceae bacterium]|nr:alpha/beta hydrolase [Steroidobacteraceae bacterium]
MHKFVRVMARVTGVVVVFLLGVLAFSAYRYSGFMAIDVSHGVNEAGYVRIGGIDQWVQIRGDDRHNPVLLWLNGGPGFTTIPATVLVRDWEREFTVVMWDQRGEGRTFNKSGAPGQGPMTVERMTEDGIELSQYLRDHLHQKKIVILGHSWGSILGVRMAMARPDLFFAYVGTGQVTSLATNAVTVYPLLRARAHVRGNIAAESELKAVGPPPYDVPKKNWVWISWANRLDPGRKPLPLSMWLPWALVKSTIDERDSGAGVQFSQQTLLEPLLRTDLPSLGYVFQVPVVMIQGSDDLVMSAVLAKNYFEKISAPHKEFILLRGDGHMAIARDRYAFLEALVKHVRPLVVLPEHAPTY